MTDRDRQLDRLAKLLALESSPNVHEADSAGRAAAALMEKHGLCREEASGRTASGYYEHPMGARGWDQAWRFSLVTAAARSCGTEAIGLVVGDRCKVRIAGAREDVERAVQLYGELLEIVLGLGRVVEVEAGMGEEVAFYGTRECKDAFRQGAVVGIVALLAKAAGESLFRGHPPQGSPAEAGPEQGALVKVSRRQTEQSERVRAKYSPDERSVDVVSALAWFGAGVQAVRSYIVIAEDGSISLRPVVGERGSGA
jgi:hypothetical protein